MRENQRLDRVVSRRPSEWPGTAKRMLFVLQGVSVHTMKNISAEIRALRP